MNQAEFKMKLKSFEKATTASKTHLFATLLPKKKYDLIIPSSP